VFASALSKYGYTKIYHPPWPFIKEGLPSIYKGVRVIAFFVTIFERALDGYTKIYHPPFRAGVIAFL